MSPPESNSQQLQRKVGVGGAILMGLGSILGTGVFVSVGLGYSLAGWMVLPAILVATCVATLNGLSSAQLAAQHPVSGGTYAYGYRWLSPFLGFSAGILFLIAKSASAATAALGCALYGFELFGADSTSFRIVVAVTIVVVLTILVAGGLKRSHWMNVGIVSFTLAALILFIAIGLGTAIQAVNWSGENGSIKTGLPGFLECCGLMFVAFTGYGRIATMGEEIVEPARNIPRAIISTLVISGLLYAAIGLVFVLSAGERQGSDEILTLKSVANQFKITWLQFVIAVAAITAMLGVLLNLILGLSRVYFAMGRNGDLPKGLGQVNERLDSPTAAVVFTGIVVAGLTLIGDIKLTWSFSAFTVLVYYALTNLSATRLSPEERRYPVFLAWLGLAFCLSLAFFIDPMVILFGTSALVLAGIGRRLFSRPGDAKPVG